MTAVEFGIVCLPFLSIILAGLQISIVFFAGQALESFTENAGRSILVGASQQQNLTQAQYKASLCAALPSLFSCSNLYIDVTTVTSFTASNLNLPQLTFDGSGNVTNTWQYNLGSSDSIVVLRILYQWPVFVLPDAVSFANQTNGSRLLMATAVFQNEHTN